MRISYATRMILATVGAAFAASPAIAFEERLEDFSVSVEVAEVSELSLTESHLAFRQVLPGEPQVLGEGRYHNQLRCRSNSGRPWYLKARVASLRHLPSQDPMPASYLKWSAVDITGHGATAGGDGHFQEFSEQPTLMYAGQGDDLRGREVVLSLQYSLTVPPTARSGSYAGDIIFSLEPAP